MSLIWYLLAKFELEFIMVDQQQRTQQQKHNAQGLQRMNDG
jgi:hypothetical protein